MAIRRLKLLLFARNKYPATVAGRTYFPHDRARVSQLAGNATRVNLQTRVFGRDTNVFLDFDVTHGSYGDEPPAEGPRSFPLTKTGASPAASPPYDTTTMPTLPDDGTYAVAPQMGNVDFQAKCYNATGSIEFETWATLEFEE